MKAIKIAFALITCTLTLFTAGCGKSKALQAAEEYEATVCACKDSKCASEALTKYTEKATKDAASVSSSETEAMTKASSAAAACATKLAMSDMPKVPGMPTGH